jgi:CPA1 family monovalent cation:H+ antiporter
VHTVEAVLGLVVLAILVAAAAGGLRTPAPSLLVVVGLGVGFIPGFSALPVSPDVVTLGVLPPLLFSGAQQISLLDLRQVWKPVAALASGLVVVTAAAVAAITHAVDPSISGTVAFTLGAVLASTDPVAVSALSRELRLPARVATLVQAESLFNDATSLVLFEVAVAAAASGHVGAGHAASQFVVLAVGGVAVGAATGILAGAALRRTHEPTAQAALTLVAPYVAAVAAHAAHVSPVTAVIVAGLLLGRRRVRSRQPEGRLVATSVYEVVVFVLENGIFAVIGLELASFLRDLPSGDTGRTIALLAAVTVALLLSRGAALAVPVVRPRRHRAGGTGPARPQWQVAAVVTWAGARGVIPLVAALAIPTNTDAGAPFPHRSMLLVVATGVVVITLVVQGSTLAPLVRRLGVMTSDDDEASELLRARHALAVAALDHLDALASAEEAPGPAVDRIRAELQQQADLTRRTLDAAEDGDAATGAGPVTPLRTRLLDVQAEELARLRLAGEISADVFRHVQRQLDIEHSRLQGG